MKLRSRLSPEARYALVVGAIALALSSLPYAAGYLAQTSDRVFDGGLVVLPDYHTHLAEMQLGLRGEWLHRLLSTSEDHAGTLMRTFYIALGHLARLFGLSLPLVFQIARIVFGALFLWAAYRFIASLAARSDVRRWAFALTALSSGLGWLMQIVAPAGPEGISPIDFWLIDANSFLSILVFPHFTAAMALLLLIFTQLIDALPEAAGRMRVNSERRSLTVIALAALVLTSIHPYAVAIVIAPAIGLGLLQAIRHRPLSFHWWRRVAAVLIGSAPVLLYSAFVFASDPIFGDWAAQNFTPSPPPIYYLIGFGLVLALAILGLRRFVKEAGDRAVLILIWLAATGVMVYVPIGIQRRFVEGAHVPLCVIAAYGLTEIGDRLAARARFVIVNLVLALAAMSNIYLVIGYTTAAAARSDRFFHSAGLIAAIDWLGTHSDWSDTVLAAETTGSLIPARIGHRVVLGHWAETVAYADRLRDVAAFFDAHTPDADRVAMMDRLGVRYVVHGDAERALGDFDPEQTDYLETAYDSGDVSVLQVVSR